MSLAPDKAQILTKSVLFDDNVNLAVAFGPLTGLVGSFFGPLGAGSGPSAVHLLIDCERTDKATIAPFIKTLARRLDLPLSVIRLSDARPAAMLMRQVLDEGEVLKDHFGQWPQLLDEHDAIVGEAEAHERWKQTLRSAVRAVIDGDDGLTLAVEYAPLRIEMERKNRTDMNLLLGCTKEGSDGPFLGAYGRLQGLPFKFQIMPLEKAREFPYALSHIVRTGEALKDVDGEWSRILGERDRIIRAGRDQQAAALMAMRLRLGPGIGSMGSTPEFN